LDASSKLYLLKAKSILPDIKAAKEAKKPLSVDRLSEYDPDAKDYSSRDLGEDGDPVVTPNGESKRRTWPHWEQRERRLISSGLS
jgi:hypothetical protein